MQLNKPTVTISTEMAAALHNVLGNLPSAQVGKLFVDFTEILIENEQDTDEVEVDNTKD